MPLTLSLDAPLLTIEEFARRTGATVLSVGKQCERRQLPFIQYEAGGRRYINMVQLTQLCDKANANKKWNK